MYKKTAVPTATRREEEEQKVAIFFLTWQALIFEMSCALPCDVSVPSRSRIIPGSASRNTKGGEGGRSQHRVRRTERKEKEEKKSGGGRCNATKLTDILPLCAEAFGVC